jgi:hypothetical protein
MVIPHPQLFYGAERISSMDQYVPASFRGPLSASHESAKGLAGDIRFDSTVGLVGLTG